MFVSFTNELSIGDDGWAQLAPFGDFPGRAMLRQPDGSVRIFDAVQRLDQAAAEGMAAKFKSPWHRVKRFITGCHIYVGHPDVPAFANEYADKTPKGMIVDLAVRADGLYCKPVFTNEGSELIESKTYRAFSGYWSAEPAGEESGRAIFRPDLLKSAGLTNRPNLPVHLMNEAQPASPTTAGDAANLETNPPPSDPIHRQLGSWLAWHGVALPNEATVEEVNTALAELDSILERTASPATPPTASPSPARSINPASNQGGERELGQPAAVVPEQAQDNAAAELARQLAESRAALANERQARIEVVLDLATASGRITAAQRAEWNGKLALEAQFANELVALQQAGPALKTRALTLDMGARKVEMANAADRYATVQQLVRAELARQGGNYDRAFAAVRQSHPALFEAMKQPQESIAS